MPDQQRADAPGHLVLVGMMGAGKSTVASLLAERLGRPVLDTDQLIEERTGRSVRALIDERGEPAFRVLEHEAVIDALGAPLPSIISLGGGALMDEGSRRSVRDAGLVVWLRAAAGTLQARLADDESRPLLRGAQGIDVGERVAQLVGERAAAYEEVASVVVDVDALDPDEVADRIAVLVAS